MTTFAQARVKLKAKIDAKMPTLVTYTAYANLGTEYDPATRTATRAGLPTTITVSPLVPYNDLAVDGDLIRAGDTSCVYPAQDAAVTPKKWDTITLGTDVWTIEGVTALPGGADNLAWELQLRR